MIRLHYFNGNSNFGDALSPLLVKRLSGQDICHASPYVADMVAAGSVFYTGHWLFRDAAHNRKLRGMLSYAKIRLKTSRVPIKVWGTGFMEYPKVPLSVARFRGIDVRAIRGKITLGILSDLGFLDKNARVPYGDPGLLYPMLLAKLPEKRYDMGVMLHYFDKEERHLIERQLGKCGCTVAFIDAVNENPLNVLNQIAECETLISSAMHGCIVADGLRIPNLPLFISSHGYDMRTYMLKYEDYYSGLGVDMPKPLLVQDIGSITRTVKCEIRERYAIPAELVERAKQNLMATFPY